MKIENVVCDECGVVKGASNHWLSAGVFFQYRTRDSIGSMLVCSVIIGDVYRCGMEPQELHDLCGEQCFHKHIAKLLRINPPAEIQVNEGE